MFFPFIRHQIHCSAAHLLSGHSLEHVPYRLLIQKPASFSAVCLTVRSDRRRCEKQEDWSPLHQLLPAFLYCSIGYSRDFDFPTSASVLVFILQGRAPHTRTHSESTLQARGMCVRPILHRSGPAEAIGKLLLGLKTARAFASAQDCSSWADLCPCRPFVPPTSGSAPRRRKEQVDQSSCKHRICRLTRY